MIKHCHASAPMRPLYSGQLTISLLVVTIAVSVHAIGALRVTASVRDDAVASWGESLRTSPYACTPRRSMPVRNRVIAVATCVTSDARGVEEYVGALYGVWDVVVESAPGAVHANATVSTSSWHLDRIDTINDRTLDGLYAPRDVSVAAVPMDVYVLDTGIDYDHRVFVEDGVPTVNAYDATDIGDGVDCSGHGTHVASTVASTLGVLQLSGATPGADVRLLSVRVLDCDGVGFYSDIIEGMIYVYDEVSAQSAPRNRMSVVVMSLGGDASAQVNDVVDALYDDLGIVSVVSAGNGNRNACLASPASAPRALTVSASTREDRRASFANFGSCVNAYAPGVDVLGAVLENRVAYLSGTSMSAPQVAAALLFFSSSGDSETTRGPLAAQRLLAIGGSGSDVALRNHNNPENMEGRALRVVVERSAPLLFVGNPNQNTPSPPTDRVPIENDPPATASARYNAPEALALALCAACTAFM